MKPIIFLGSGAVASEVISYLEDIQKYDSSRKFEIFGFLDDFEDCFEKNSRKFNYNSPLLGTIKDHKFSPDYDYIFGFSLPEAKENFIKNIDIQAISFPTIIHPSAIISKHSKIGIGNVIYPNCVVGPNCEIGNFNLITSYSFISHDCRIGNFNFLSTAGLSGNVSVGNTNFFGIRSTVIPSVSIGSNNVIQAGMVIDKNVSDNETVFYRFKEKISIIK